LILWQQRFGTGTGPIGGAGKKKDTAHRVEDVLLCRGSKKINPEI